MELDFFVLNSGQTIEMHAAAVCMPPCAVHAPSDHHMVDWPLVWRGDRRIFERRCEHGVGHPDPDTLSWFRRTLGAERAHTESIHGCDGCCFAGGGG